MLTIRHLHISHNAPYLLPQILHNLCFLFLLRFTAIQREIENNAYGKCCGANKVQYGRCVSGVSPETFWLSQQDILLSVVVDIWLYLHKWQLILTMSYPVDTGELGSHLKYIQVNTWKCMMFDMIGHSWCTFQMADQHHWLESEDKRFLPRSV